MTSYLTRLKDKMGLSTTRAIPQTEQQLIDDMAQRLGGVGGETARLLEQGGEAFDDDMLLRFLHAEKNNAASAAARLETYAQWRGNECPMRCIDESEVANELSAGKVFLTNAADKEGHPLMVILGAKHYAATRDLDECGRSAIYTLDIMISRMNRQSNPSGKMCILVDMRGVAYANLDGAVLKVIFKILGNYYPERLHAVWFYEAPTIFYGVWRMVSPFLDPVSKSKVQFVYASDGSDAKLWATFDKKDIPKEFGGEAVMFPVVEHGLPPAKTKNKGQVDSEHRHRVSLPDDSPEAILEAQQVAAEIGTSPGPETQGILPSTTPAATNGTSALDNANNAPGNVGSAPGNGSAPPVNGSSAPANVK